MSRYNGHTSCCGRASILRLIVETGELEYCCCTCTRKGGRSMDPHEVGMNWKMSALRTTKHADKLAAQSTPTNDEHHL